MRGSTVELGPNSDDCSRLFFKLKNVFLSRKDFFNSKGVGLEKESNKILLSFENLKLATALICPLILLIGILCIKEETLLQ